MRLSRTIRDAAVLPPDQYDYVVKLFWSNLHPLGFIDGYCCAAILSGYTDQQRLSVI